MLVKVLTSLSRIPLKLKLELLGHIRMITWNQLDANSGASLNCGSVTSVSLRRQLNPRD
jgi:hypothetical protein